MDKVREYSPTCNTLGSLPVVPWIAYYKSSTKERKNMLWETESSNQNLLIKDNYDWVGPQVAISLHTL
jgi:hypothetical protein